MIDQLLEQQTIRQTLAHRIGADPATLEFTTRPLRGGLDSRGVISVKVRGQFLGKPRSFTFVLKRLTSTQNREAAFYRAAHSVGLADFAPGLICAHETADECWLLLDAVRPAMRWPWREESFSLQVMETLSSLHQVPLETHLDSCWDYDRELVRRGEELLNLLSWIPSRDALGWARRSISPLRRLVEALPVLRRQLLELAPWGRTFIHGDVHPGNVLVTRSNGRFKSILVDWGRSRVGSPLEDVSSWLQSLRYWEAEARRRHDTLLAAYLRARGDSSAIDRTLRDAYWLAAASNLLAGAITYHLMIAQDASLTPHRRTAAAHALGDALRVIRRADERHTATRFVSPRVCK